MLEGHGVLKKFRPGDDVAVTHFAGRQDYSFGNAGCC